jgi:hypothetical protein
MTKRTKLTKAQKNFLLGVKSLPCIVCFPEWYDTEPLKDGEHGYDLNDADHVTGAQGRVGHDYLIALCYDHHRGNEGYSGIRKSWDTSHANQLELCRKTYKKLGLEFCEPISKIVKRKV